MSDEEVLLDEEERNVGYDDEIQSEIQLTEIATENSTSRQTLSIDEVLLKIGECGRFQIVTLILMCVTMIPMAFPPLIFYYIGYDPPWICNDNVTHANNTFCDTHNSSTLFQHSSNERCGLDFNEWKFVNHGKSTIVTEVHKYISRIIFNIEYCSNSCLPLQNSTQNNVLYQLF